MKKSATKVSNPEMHSPPTARAHSKPKKRALDVIDSSDSKSITKKSLSDKPFKTKKVKHSNALSRKSSKLHAHMTSQIRKPHHESSRPERSASTTHHKAEDKDSKTAMLLKGFESSDDEGSLGQNLGSEAIRALEEIPAVPELRQTADDTESKVSTKHKDAGVVYVG